jgi:uncharacterized membrane protein YedE/YeeE
MTWQALLALGAALGFLYGFLLQKGDFCFCCAFRDWFAFRDTRVGRGILVGVLLTMVGWSVALQAGWAPASHLWVPPVGLSDLIGGFVFGVGMVITGGCASSTLYRAGAGYLYFWVVLAFMGVGYGLFSALYEPWLARHFFAPLRLAPPLTLYDLLRPVPRPAVSLALTAAVTALLVRRLGWRALREEAAAALAGLRHPVRLLRAKSWDTALVGAVLSAVAFVQFLFLGVWGITGAESRWTGLAVRAVAGPAPVAANPYWGKVLFASYPGIVAGPEELLVAFMVVGALVAALLGGSFRIRLPRWERLPNAAVGGLLLGFGSRLAPGCNVGNVFSGLAELSVHSIVASAGILGGIYVATQFAYGRVRLPRRQRVLAQSAD